MDFATKALEKLGSGVANELVDRISSGVVDELVSKISSVLQRYNLKPAAHGKLERLKELLTSIECILEAASGKEIKNKHLANWLNDLNGAVKEAGDLMSDIESQGTERVRAPSSSNPFKRMCIAPYHAAINVLVRHMDDVKLSKLVQRFESINSQANTLVGLLNL